MTFRTSSTLLLLTVISFIHGCALQHPQDRLVPVPCPPVEYDPLIFQRPQTQAMQRLTDYLQMHSPSVKATPPGKTR